MPRRFDRYGWLPAPGAEQNPRLVTLYRAVLTKGDDEDASTLELDSRDRAIEWAVGRLTPEHDTVVLEHQGAGGWERIGVFNTDEGSGPDAALPDAEQAG